MPLYGYICENCKTQIEEFRTIAKRFNIKCSKCQSDKMTIVLFPHHVLTKNKWKESGKNSIDSGIPFGTVPGDDDYKDINNPLGPKP